MYVEKHKNINDGIISYLYKEYISQKWNRISLYAREAQLIRKFFI